MRSRTMEKLLKLLLVLLGIGIGLAVAQLGLAVYRQSHQTADIPTWVPWRPIPAWRSWAA